MAFTRPTLIQIRDRVEQDYKAAFNLTTILSRSFFKVFAAIISGVSHTLHGHIQDFVQKQFFPDTADEEYLVRWANIFGITRLSATEARINVTITGTPTTVVPAGTLFQRSDGVEYALDSEVTIDGGGSIAGLLVAVEAGSDGNIDDGSTVSLTSPISGVNSDATVDSTDTEGEDEETIEDLRTRLIARIQAPPAGGTVFDYIAFARTVVGVTRVWVLPNHLGQGTVGLTFVEDNEDPIIPSAAKVDEVQDAVDTQKPVTAEAFVFAPTETTVDPVISIKPNTSDVQAAVIQELQDMILREAQVRGAVNPDEVAEGTIYDGAIPLSKFTEAISIAAGEQDHVLVTPSSAPQPPVGGLLTLGTVTFTTLP